MKCEICYKIVNPADYHGHMEGHYLELKNNPARSTSEFNLRGIKNCPICGTEIVATPNGIQPRHPITALCSCYSAGLEPSEDCPIHGYKPL